MVLFYLWCYIFLFHPLHIYSLHKSVVVSKYTVMYKNAETDIDIQSVQHIKNNNIIQYVHEQSI